MNKRRAFTVLIVAGLTAVGYAGKPHILYINADDLGVMDVGYNRSDYHTPNIDTLTHQGMIFTQAYAPAANCAPSRAMVHSGQVAARHGIYTVGSSERGNPKHRKLIPIENKTELPDEVVTIAEALKASDYVSIHLGKWHLGNDPRTQGFDVNIGGDQSGGPGGGGYFSPWTGSMKPFSDRYPKGTHRMDVFAAETISFMKQNKDRPMFIHLAPYLIHSKLEPVPEYVDKYKNAAVKAVYASCIEKMDEGIGKILKAIDELGLTDNMLVVFCSDNGGICSESSQAPFRAGKGSYYEGGVREPLVMRWPGKIKEGSQCDTPVSSIDFYPTFLDVSGTAVPHGKVLDGVSLLPLMTGEGRFPERALFWHFPIYLQAYRGEADQARDPVFRTRPGSSLRIGKWKLHHYFEDDAWELYDLEQDVGERNNLAASMPEKLSELQKVLHDWREKTGSPIPAKLNPEYDAAADEAKRKL